MRQFLNRSFVFPVATSTALRSRKARLLSVVKKIVGLSGVGVNQLLEAENGRRALEVVLVVDRVADRLIESMQRHGARLLSEQELRKVERLVFTEPVDEPRHGMVDVRWVGKDADRILAAVGGRVDREIRLLIADVPRATPLVYTEPLLPVLPGVVEPRTGLSMGQSCEQMARDWQVTREEQDQLACESHQSAAAACAEGFYDDLVVGFEGLAADDNVRRDTTLEKLARLRPVFARDGTLTAGNSTPMTDGASAVLLASEDWARERGLPVQAWLTFGKVAAVNFMGAEGLLMAPAYAVPRMLADARLELQDFDFYEIHEAFAAQVLCTLKAWESPAFCRDRLGLDAPLGSIDRGMLNVKGGSLAIGQGSALGRSGILSMFCRRLTKKHTFRSSKLWMPIPGSNSRSITAGSFMTGSWRNIPNLSITLKN